MDYPFQQPKTEITLKVADEGDKKIWVYESWTQVVEAIEQATIDSATFVKFSRVKGIGNPGVDFATKPSNVINVKDISK